MSAIVTDGEERVGLAVTRSLGINNTHVTTSSKSKLAAAFYSKYSKSHFVYPDPAVSIKSFIKFMVNYARENKHDVLIPISDFTTPTLSYYRKKFLPHIKIPLVDHDTLMITYDKTKTLKAAKRFGIPIPKTYFPKNISELEKLASKLEYPVTIKPNRTKIWVKDKIVSQNVGFARSRQELITKYKEMYNKNEPPLIQEYIPGIGYGFFGLFNNSKPRAIFMHRRIREFPIGRGASTLRVSVNHPNIKKLGMKFLQSLKWHGVAMVEFRLDERDKLPKLMEVNGRFWGSLPLAITAGVDFPYLLYKMTLDGDVKKVERYKIGVKSRWLVGDIYRLISALTGSYDKEIVKNVSRLQSIIDFLKFYEKDLHYDMFYSDDLLPGFVNLLYSGQRAVAYVVGR